MKYEVIIENSAERDLLEILTYISETLLEPAAAKRIYLSIKEQAQSLDHMPFRYNVIQEEPYCQMGVRRLKITLRFMWWMKPDIPYISSGFYTIAGNGKA